MLFEVVSTRKQKADINWCFFYCQLLLLFELLMKNKVTDQRFIISA